MKGFSYCKFVEIPFAFYSLDKLQISVNLFLLSKGKLSVSVNEPSRVLGSNLCSSSRFIPRRIEPVPVQHVSGPWTSTGSCSSERGGALVCGPAAPLLLLLRRGRRRRHRRRIAVGDCLLGSSRWRLVMRLQIWHLFPVAGLNLQSRRFHAAEVLLPNFLEGRAELLDAKSVDNGVDGGVAVGEEDGDVEEDYGLLALGTEERDAVDDVQRQPAEGEEEKDQSQRFGQVQLLVVVLVGVCVTGVKLLIVKLLMNHVEDLCIDNQHEQQGRQHPAEKVEVDHVVHADDVLKLAGDDVVGADGAVLLQAPQVVPS